MKKKVKILFISFIIISIIPQSTPLKGVQSEWSSTITARTYYWKALKSELRDLNTREQYHDKYLIGGINVPGGDNGVHLESTPPNDFDLFNGSRLDLDVGVEGDMGIELPKYGSDFHLLLLPIKTNNRSFFEVLFEERVLLENLTHSDYLNSSISDTIARAYLKYNDVLDIQYEWDTTTGLLIRKEVTAPSGLQLIVVPGKGSLVPGWSFSIVLLTVLIWWYTNRRNGLKDN